MSLPEGGALPPGRVADGKECHVQLARTHPERTLHEQMRRLSETRVSGEEAAFGGILQQVHVGSRATAVIAVAVAFVARGSRVHVQGADADRVVGREWCHVPVPALMQPPGD